MQRFIPQYIRTEKRKKSATINDLTTCDAMLDHDQQLTQMHAATPRRGGNSATRLASRMPSDAACPANDWGGASWLGVGGSVLHLNTIICRLMILISA